MSWRFEYEEIDMKILKDIIKSAVISIMASMTIFVIVGVIFDQIGNGVFSLTDYSFTKMAVACVVTGMGFSVPTFLYSMENIPKLLASVIHLGIGFTLYFIAAMTVGWIPTEAGVTAVIITVVGMIVIGIIIWACFMSYIKRTAAEINKAIEAKN